MTQLCARTHPTRLPTRRNGVADTEVHVHQQSTHIQRMVKFLKPNKAVILLQGRFSGHKSTIVQKPTLRCLVAGIAKYPSKVIRKDPVKKSRVKAFVKLVNYNHIMPTRYTLDVDLEDIVFPDALPSGDKKVTACKEIKPRFEQISCM